MQKIDSTINNLLSNSINLEVTNLSERITAYIDLKPGENFKLKVFDCNHEVKVLKVNGLPVNQTFVLKISSFMAISQDLLTNEIFIQDFVSNTKYRAENKVDDQKPEFVSARNPGYAGNSNVYSQSNVSYGNSGRPATSYSSSYNTSYPSSSNTTGYPSSSYTTSYPSNNNTTSYPSNSFTTNYSSVKPGTYSYNFNNDFGKDFSVPNNSGNSTNYKYTSKNYVSPYNNTNTQFTNFNSNTNNIGGGYNIQTTNNYGQPTTTTKTIYNPTNGGVTISTINNSNFGNFNDQFQNFNINDPFKNFDMQFPNNTVTIKNYGGDVFDTVKFDDFGKFVSTIQEFDTNFIKADIINNTLNIFNQLHKKNMKKEDKEKLDFAEDNQIKITNKSETRVYVRLSGTGAEDDATYMLFQNQDESWERKPNSIYKINITTNPAYAGITYNVKSGCKYLIDEQCNLTDPGKNTLTSNSSPYNQNFESVNQFGIFYNRDDVTMLEALKTDKSLIIVVNRGDDTLHVKIDADLAAGSEDYIDIEPLVYLVFKRKAGSSYVLTYNKRGLQNTLKHKVASGTAYSFADQSLGLCDDSTKRSVEIYIPAEVEQPKQVLNAYWEKIKDLIKSHPNRNKLKAFNNLLFGQINITNNSNVSAYVRVKSRKIGSEDFVEISSQNESNWKRLDGLYLAEVVSLNDLRSKRYLLQNDVSYSLNANLEVVDARNNMVLPQVNERFTSTQLVYYDQTQRTYLRKEILYSEDSLNPQKGNRRAVLDNKTDLNNYEYFNDIKPNYKPGQPFTDQYFPPDASSLRAIDPLTGIKRTPHFVHAKKGLSESAIDFIGFSRPKDAFPGQYYLFKDEICYDDVKQGQIGNCYLISILAALSQRPDLIRAVFKTQTVNPDGFYELFYHENGQKKIIFIDDNIVMMKSTFFKEFQFAQPNGEELWVMLIEKAYAKYEGGYSNVLGGLMYPELKWLTGALTREIKTSDPQCWNEVYNACKARHILVTGSVTGSGNHDIKSQKGISNGHAYSILDAKEYRKAGSSENLRLVKMRNPWGHTEWKGDYCDNSPLWTPELKRFFGFVDGGKDSDDGVFFMPFEDYLKEFKNVIICAIDSKN